MVMMFIYVVISKSKLYGQNLSKTRHHKSDAYICHRSCHQRQQQQKAPADGMIKQHETYAELKHGTMEATKCKSGSFPPDVAPG